MRTMSWVMGVWLVGLAALTAGAGEDFYLVKVKGLDKRAVIQVMSTAEFKALEAAIKLEQKYLPKAIAEAGKEWREDDFNKKSPYVGNKLSARTIMSAMKYSSQEKASDALTKAEDLQAKKDEREFSKKAGKSKDQIRLESDLMTVSALVQTKLDALIAAGGKADAKAAPAKEGAPAMEVPGGAKVNAAVEKFNK